MKWKLKGYIGQLIGVTNCSMWGKKREILQWRQEAYISGKSPFDIGGAVTRRVACSGPLVQCPSRYTHGVQWHLRYTQGSPPGQALKEQRHPWQTGASNSEQPLGPLQTGKERGGGDEDHPTYMGNTLEQAFFGASSSNRHGVSSLRRDRVLLLDFSEPLCDEVGTCSPPKMATMGQKALAAAHMSQMEGRKFFHTIHITGNKSFCQEIVKPAIQPN